MSQRLPDEVVQRVQSNVNIVDIVGQYVPLRKRGKNYFGHCPFHDERTPSFSVTEEKQIYHCFSCGRGGSVFSFISEIEGLTFAESVVRVAELAQIPIDVKLVSSRESKEQSEHRHLYLAHQKAGELYQHVLLQTRGGERALAYAMERGYTIETIELFQMGFSLKDRTIVANLVSQLSLNRDEMVATGLFVERTDGFIDRFYQRLMIPLRNPNGQIIGFSGRVIPDESDDPQIQDAKYLNSPETPLFNKRQFLFNLDLAKGEIRKKNQVVLFEGYMDVIAAYQAGVKNGVASMGTSLTVEQIQLLSRLTSEVVIAYDGDRAGLEATHRAIELLQQHAQLKISILPLEDGVDPDEYIHKKGSEAFQNLLNHHTESVFQFKKRFFSKTYRLEIERERVLFLEQMVAELAKISKPIEREVAIQALAEEFQLEPALLSSQVHSQVRQLRPVTQSQVSMSQATILSQDTPLEKAQKQLLYRLMHSKEAWTYFFHQDENFVFPTPAYHQLYQLMSAFRQISDGDFNRQDFLNFLKEDDVANRNLTTAIEWMDFPEECSEQEVRDLMDRLSRKNTLTQLYEQKKRALQEAQLAGKVQEANTLMLELVTIQKQLKQK